MIVAGLTGGIATGKSTVAAMLKAAGAVVIDADQVAREAVRRGSAAWEKIRQHFGPGILAPDGEIDRVALGDIIFHDHEQKKVLDSIVHPFVFAEVADQLKEIAARQKDAVVILDVPLLFETGMHKAMTDVVLVYIPETLQLKRLMARDQISAEAAMARIRSQMPIEEKKQLAGIVIDNSEGLAETQIRALAVYRDLFERR